EDRERDLDDEHEEQRRLVNPERELVHPPRERRRERRRLVVARHGREVAPARVSRDELREARLDVELEDEAEDERLRDGSRGARSSRAPAPRRREPREERRLYEERVPLELEEAAPGTREGEVERPEE